MFASFVLAAAVGIAPPVTINLSELKAGKLPAAGTIAEADSCALVTSLVFMQTSGVFTGTGTTESRNQQVQMSKAWMARAASFRSIPLKEFHRDKSFEKALIAVTKIKLSTQLALDKECGARLTPSV